MDIVLPLNLFDLMDIPKRNETYRKLYVLDEVKAIYWVHGDVDLLVKSG